MDRHEDRFGSRFPYASNIAQSGSLGTARGRYAPTPHIQAMWPPRLQKDVHDAITARERARTTYRSSSIPSLKRLDRGRPLCGGALAQHIDAKNEDDDNRDIQTDVHQVLLEEFLLGISGHQFQLMG